MEKTKIFSLIISFALLTSMICSCTNRDSVVINSNNKKIKVYVYIADEEKEWALGLMDTTKLLENEGMIFIFPEEDIRRFYMKNMKFNIDIMFISADGKIVDMVDNFEICKEDPCPIYQSGMPAKYVLEVNSGFILKNRIKIDDIVEMPK